MARAGLPTQPSLLSAPGKALIHRDLSWLQFNERVLAEAQDPKHPWLERLKFLAISASNLDEFFMIRVASVGRAIAQAERQGNQKALAAEKRIRTSIFKSVAALAKAQDECFARLATGLESQGIRLMTRIAADDPARELALQVFEEEVFPYLEGPEPAQAQKLTQASNLGMIAWFENQVFVHVPKLLPPAYLKLDPRTGKPHVFFLDWLLFAFLGPKLHLPGYPGLVRLTRDGDVTADLKETSEEGSLAELIRTRLTVRDRGRPVRLQIAPNAPAATVHRLRATFRLEPQQVIPQSKTLCLHGLFGVVSKASRETKIPRALFFDHFEAPIPGPFREGRDLFAELRRRDLLLHHPYDSFAAYERWIEAAARDPRVQSIDQTIYRIDAASPLIQALKEAAKTKRVRVAIELRARFDELNNLKLAEELKRAGVEVVFGFGKLKLHAKVALVSREEDDGLRYYTHLSTGNYNAATARQYTDLSILTADPTIGQDAHQFFTAVAAGKLPTAFKTLVPAPMKLHRKMLSLIESETEAAHAGRPARIVAKMNALVDESIIDALYRASQAGVQVDLLVRGPCSLIPGVAGLSENIQVVSVVDRYLEHSRFYYFESSRAMYLSSADWMPRNFFSRLELAFPVLDDRLLGYLRDQLIPTYFRDTVKARELSSRGDWKLRSAPKGQPRGERSQIAFQRMALDDYRGTRLAPEPSERTLIVVRHAHRDFPDGRAADNGLSEKGRAQAKRVERQFERRFGPDAQPRLLSSPKLRCRETIEGLARKTGVSVEVEPLLDEGDSLAPNINQFLQAWKLSNHPGPTVLCSHGDWIPEFLEKTTGRHLDLDKGGWVELRLKADGTLRIHEVLQAIPE